MIISRAPFRVSFFGGGTDYPVWFREHPGAVLVTSINKYSYISARWLPPFFEHQSRIVWSKVELVGAHEQIQHPSVRECLAMLGIAQGIEVHHTGDLPARTGLGSSSSFTVGLLHALHGLKGAMPSKAQLAREAITVEQERLGEAVGCQDQIAAAFGGLNRIDFTPDGGFRVSPVIVAEERLSALQDHLMLFFTGMSRTASEVAVEQIKATASRARELTAMHAMVDQAMAVLQGSDDLSAFGRLLDASWRLKRSLTARISTPQIDALYDTARRAGAIGGKLLGAGGGGFLLVFARPEEQPRVREALRELLHVPFRMERLGSQVLFYEPDATHAPVPARPIADPAPVEVAA
jgi:D-glycero-alpha-D-manno-heptose-7-phosphate kinase